MCAHVREARARGSQDRRAHPKDRRELGLGHSHPKDGSDVRRSCLISLLTRNTCTRQPSLRTVQYMVRP